MARFDFMATPRALDINADPVSGGKLYMYEAGTTTPVTTYTDAALSIAHPHPIIADSAGQFDPVYIAMGTYKWRLTDAGDVTLMEADNVFSAADVSVYGPELSLATAAINRINGGSYTMVAADIEDGSLFDLTNDGVTDIKYPVGTFETSTQQLFHMERGTDPDDAAADSDNDQLEMKGLRLDGHGCSIRYEGTGFAFENDQQELIYRRVNLNFQGFNIRGNTSAKGGIRAIMVHHSLIMHNNVWNFDNGFGIFLDAFGNRSTANSQGGANNNVIMLNKLGEDLQPFEDDDSCPDDRCIQYGIVVAGSRAVRATAGQNLIMSNKYFNFKRAGLMFSGIGPATGIDLSDVDYFPPKAGYRQCEGAVGNYVIADTYVCQRTLTSCFYSALGVEKDDEDKTMPPVAVYYDARNGLTLNDCHMEKTGIPVLVSHGADRELSMGSNQLTNSGFPDGEGAVENGKNFNRPVVQAWPEAASGHGLATDFDPIDFDHYIRGDEHLTTAFDATTTWYAEGSPAALDKTTTAYTLTSEFEDALHFRKNQRVLPLVDYDKLTVGG